MKTFRHFLVENKFCYCLALNDYCITLTAFCKSKKKADAVFAKAFMCKIFFMSI